MLKYEIRRECNTQSSLCYFHMLSFIKYINDINECFRRKTNISSRTVQISFMKKSFLKHFIFKKKKIKGNRPHKKIEFTHLHCPFLSRSAIVCWQFCSYNGYEKFIKKFSLSY